MFFKKKNKKGEKADNKIKEIDTGSDSEIYVMPDKFFGGKNPKKGGTSNKGLIIAVVVFLIALSASGAFFWYDSVSQKQNNIAKTDKDDWIDTSDENNNQKDESNGIFDNNTDDNSNNEARLGEDNYLTDNSPTSTDELPEKEKDDDEKDDESDKDNDKVDNNKPTETNKNKIAPDADNDGLTDIEESIVGSSATKPDTDGDGYLDGEEIRYGYDPVVAGDAKAKDGNWAAVLKTSFSDDNFQLVYPADWAVNTVEVSRQAVVTANTGEIIKISVKDNKDELSAANWYLKNNRSISLSDLISINTTGGLSGVFSPNGLSAYLTNEAKTKMYVFEYIKDADSDIRYPAIFSMMVKTFEIYFPTNEEEQNTAE